MLDKNGPIKLGIFIVFLTVIFLLPTLLLSCGGSISFVSLMNGAGQCHGDWQKHLDIYANFFLSGLETFILFFILIAVRRALFFFAVSADLKKMSPFLRRYWQESGRWRMKPFDRMILAFSRGLIHPKNPASP